MTGLASRGQLRASFLRWALVIVAGVSLLGFLSGRLSQSGPGNPWLESLDKPTLFPPFATFDLIWSLLYVLMGLALAMVVTARGAPGRGIAIAAFLFQLVLNLSWPPLFFGAHRLDAAFYLLVALDLAVLATVVLFWRVRRPAALLLLPYLAWIVFATVLAWQLLEANPGGAPAATTRFAI
jgi:benzodiazapine receptor